MKKETVKTEPKKAVKPAKKEPKVQKTVKKTVKKEKFPKEIELLIKEQEDLNKKISAKIEDFQKNRDSIPDNLRGTLLAKIGALQSYGYALKNEIDAKIGLFVASKLIEKVEEQNKKQK